LDSCPAGLGRYYDQGFAWRFYLPENLKFQSPNNLLKHIAAIISPWIDILADQLKDGDCFLSIGDSTTLEGWLGNTNFLEEGDDLIQALIKLKVARLYTSHFLANGIHEYSQWFYGAENNVANALSRDNDQSNKDKKTSSAPTAPLRFLGILKLLQYPAR
jgi:hypothetical protein